MMLAMPLLSLASTTSMSSILECGSFGPWPSKVALTLTERVPHRLVGHLSSHMRSAERAIAGASATVLSMTRRRYALSVLALQLAWTTSVSWPPTEFSPPMLSAPSFPITPLRMSTILGISPCWSYPWTLGVSLKSTASSLLFAVSRALWTATLTMAAVVAATTRTALTRTTMSLQATATEILSPILLLPTAQTSIRLRAAATAVHNPMLPLPTARWTAHLRVDFMRWPARR